MIIQELKHIFNLAKEKNIDVCIELTVPGRDDHEFIIVLNSNLDYKLKYYIDNYSNELILNRCNDIRIVNAFPLAWLK